MKTVISFITWVIFAFSSSCGHARNQSSDKQSEKMLQDFYIAYNTVWATTPSSIPADILHKKLDSLIEKYCTSRLRKEAKEWLEDGHDLITNDEGADVEHLTTLSVTKDSTKANTYVVSYIVNSFPGSPNEPVKKKVTLQVAVVKEKESYKIDAVR